MMISIPTTKSEVERRYERGEWYPAINVKVYRGIEYTAEKVAAECGCDMATAERAATWVYESAVEQFWEQALDSLNFAMLGDEKASLYKPCGLHDGPYTIECDGRMGGWLVAKGLPALETWNGTALMKWRKFCRLINSEMEYLASWEYAREMIEANDWAPRTGTVEANHENARATPTDRLARAALAIHGELNGQEWKGADTLDRIADHLRAAGLAIAEYTEG